MSSWSAIYSRASLPSGFRPAVEGTCFARQLSFGVELALPGVADGEATALALSKQVSGLVIWAYVQTTASCVGLMHAENGEVLRRIEFADGSWRRVEGRPQPWEDWLFSVEELEAAREVSDPEDDDELAEVFARRQLEPGHRLPSPREWQTLFHAVGVGEADWRAAQAAPPMLTLEGSKTSKLTTFARLTLAVSVGSFVGFWATRKGDFAALGAVCLLFAFGAGFLRKATVGRWFV